MMTRTHDAHLTLWGCGLVLAAQLVFAPLEARMFGPQFLWFDLGHASLALVGGLLLLARWPHVPRGLALAVFAVVALAYVPNIWVTERTAFHLGRLRDPLTTHQFVMVGVAALAPGPLWFGAVLLAILSASAVALWMSVAGLHPGILAATGEPWMTLILALVSGTVFVMRTQRFEIFCKFTKAQAQRDALARAARIFLSVRDRANSPLQTLEFAVALLRRRHPEGASLVTSLEESSKRLQALMRVLDSTESWVGGHLDPRVDLDAEVRAAAEAFTHAGDDATLQP